jgi:hypothetical protein
MFDGRIGDKSELNSIEERVEIVNDILAYISNNSYGLDGNSIQLIAATILGKIFLVLEDHSMKRDGKPISLSSFLNIFSKVLTVRIDEMKEDLLTCH